jgi:hypothetical protein
MALTIPNAVLHEGYKVTGGRSTPLRATVPYLVKWADAFNFYDEILGQTSAVSPIPGAIIRTPGHAFPPAPIIFAQDATIEPCGAGGSPIDASFKGLLPGQHFTHAIVTVEYSAPSYDQTGDGDPLKHLDPDNPITYCEYEVESRARFDTEKAAGWEFADGTSVKGDFARLSIESKLVLTFPRVPFVPWRVVKPYIGCVNSVTVFDCARGTLLLEELRIKANETNQGLAGTSTQLVFSNQDHEWNALRRTDTGAFALVRKKGSPSESICQYKDIRDIFL